jgi:hypothetical protein
MKTHWKKLTNPNYLGAYDFQQGEKRIVTIKEVIQEKVLNVTLYVTMVSAFGQTVEALRIEPVKPKALPSLTSEH